MRKPHNRKAEHEPKLESHPMSQYGPVLYGNPGFPGFETPGRSSSLSQNCLELAKSCLPLYGGTTPTDTESSSGSTGTGQEAAQTGGQSGNDTPTTTPGGDSGQQEMDPQQIADLLKQVTQLTAANKQLLTENNTFKAKQQESERASQTREQTLEADLQNAMETITKMDAALKNQAVLNAINGYGDIQFHDPKFVMHELDPSIYESMEVDLENGTVTVSGIENELKRIAREKDWSVKKMAQPTTSGSQQSGKPPARGSGTPPPPPNGSNDKASRRQALIDKYPVIAHGRSL